MANSLANSAPARSTAALVALLQELITFDRVKSSLFTYVFVSYVLKAYRHIQSRGARLTVRDGWRGISRVRLSYIYMLWINFCIDQPTMVISLSLVLYYGFHQYNEKSKPKWERRRATSNPNSYHPDPQSFVTLPYHPLATTSSGSKRK